MKRTTTAPENPHPAGTGGGEPEGSPEPRPLKVDLRDVFRATLPERTGNTGYLGLAPDGSGYHVVVPVDVQIARGIKAGHRPTDGTPFGGYSGWAYFECRPYPWPEAGSGGELAARWKQSRANAEVLQAWARGLGLKVEISRPA